ncbi:Mu transposase C-terminal domain-containing protein [Agrobacterium rosae]|uniref:Mu transposase C-terminal domain-containing protein n=1 Tax=Agrobacterium rosae TaxID=1972867 RepID=A0ABU4W2G1_9HYPH|nr:Mu transposase C-terminal domain-containing protein [Agrobacterium rosae]MDX8331969.1 Mu transposase C-terminal domain-containing protein [Agrobacterium rosae]
MTEPEKKPDTVFTIESEDRVKFLGRFFKATPSTCGYVLSELGGSARHELEDWQITEHIFQRVIKVERGYFGIDAMNARGLRYALDAPDLPKDTVYRTRMVHMFLEGQQGGRWKRSEKCVNEFYKEFDAVEDEYRKSRGGTKRQDATDKTRVEWRQFLRIVKLFETRGRTPNALVKNYTGSNLHTKNVDYEREGFLREWAQKKATRHKDSGEALYGEMVTANEKLTIPFVLPTLRTFQRRIKKLERLRLDAGIHGVEVAVARLAISQGGLEVTRPLERVEMDEKVIDLIVFLTDTGIWDALHEDVQKAIMRVKRPYISVAIDYATRSVLAMRLLREAPKAGNSIETLRMALLPKDDYARRAGAVSGWPMCGTMELVATDAGSAYANDDFLACVLMATGRHLFPPSKTPVLRGTIERFFKTVDDRYMHLFSGRTFGNVLARGNYNSVANASMTFDRLADALVRLIVDCYHHTPHASLNGEMPIDAWSRLNAIYRVKPPPTDEELAQIFSVTMTRKIGDNGLVFLGIPYGDEALQKLRNLLGGATVQMRVNPYNLGSVRMLTQDGRGYVIVPAMRDGFEGVTTAEWSAVLRTMDKRFADRAKIFDDTVRRAMAEVKAISTNAMADAGIGDPTLTREVFERIDRQLVRGWVVPRRSKADHSIPSEPPSTVSEKEEASPLSGDDKRKLLVHGMSNAPIKPLQGLRKMQDGRQAIRPAPENGLADPTLAGPRQQTEQPQTKTKPAASSRRWTFEKK